jgi:hypothetical protein
MNGPPDDQVQGSVGQSNIWTITLRSIQVSRISVEAPIKIRYNNKFRYFRKSAMGEAPNYTDLSRSQLDARRSDDTRAPLTLSASGLTFLAGFGAEAVVLLLPSLVTCLFMSTK